MSDTSSDPADFAEKPKFNSDLWLSEDDRRYARTRYGNLADFLIWEELQKEFLIHENIANRAKKKARKFGFIALGLLAASVLLTWCIANFLREDSLTAQVVAVVAILLTIIGALLSKFILIGSKKDKWLHHRIAAERLRQLQYQFFAANLFAVAAALKRDDQGDLTPEAQNLGAQLREHRNRALEHVKRDCDPTRFPLEQNLLKDDDSSECWMIKPLPGFADGSNSASLEPEMTLVLNAYRENRIEAQITHTQRVLDEAGYSLKKFSLAIREKLAHKSEFALTVAIVLLQFAACFSILFWGDQHVFKLLSALWGLCAILVVILKGYEESQKLPAELARYRIYQCGARKVLRRFDAAETSAGKKAYMEEMEELAYFELREFVLLHEDAAFSM